jgi:prepilin-type N-terminal cleavage/methylation domain-containing protein
MENKGLSLVELLIAVSIFGFLAVALIGIFVSAMNAQSSVLQNQEIISQASYALEYMDRSIRMALRDDAGDCVGIAGKNYNTASGITFLAFDTMAEEEPYYRCKRFYLDDDDNKIKEQKSIDETAANFGTGVELTSSKVKINSLVFSVVGDVVDTAQPQVTILIDIESNNRRLTPLPGMVLQTTISQRNLNIGD